MDISKLEKAKNLPFHKFLGINEFSTSAGRGELKIVVNENMANMIGVMHGGIIYSLCDTTAYIALMSVLDENIEVVTHDVHVSVLSSAKMGDEVKFIANVVKKGRRVCFTEVKAYVGEKVIAMATVTKSIL
jgi:uncharacterized protein (TIGR00369 family)